MTINDEVPSPFIQTPETLVLTRHIEMFSNKDLLVTELIYKFTKPDRMLHKSKTICRFCGWISISSNKVYEKL